MSSLLSMIVSSLESGIDAYHIICDFSDMSQYKEKILKSIPIKLNRKLPSCKRNESFIEYRSIGFHVPVLNFLP